jgi:hypothetical protein
MSIAVCAEIHIAPHGKSRLAGGNIEQGSGTRVLRKMVGLD